MKRKTINRLLSTLLIFVLAVGEIGSTGISAFAAREEKEGEYGYEDAIISSDEDADDSAAESYDVPGDETSRMYEAADTDGIVEDDSMVSTGYAGQKVWKDKESNRGNDRDLF